MKELVCVTQVLYTNQLVGRKGRFFFFFEVLARFTDGKVEIQVWKSKTKLISLRNFQGPTDEPTYKTETDSQT